MCLCGNAVYAMLRSAYLCIYLQSYSTAYFLHPHGKTKTPTYTFRTHLSPAFFHVVSHLHRQAIQHTHKKKIPELFLTMRWDCLTFGLSPGGFGTSIPPQQRGLSLGLLSPTGSLPGAHLLSLCTLCMKLPHVCTGCCLLSPPPHTHTHADTHAPVSPNSEIGQEARL